MPALLINLLTTAVVAALIIGVSFTVNLLGRTRRSGAPLERDSKRWLLVAGVAVDLTGLVILVVSHSRNSSHETTGLMLITLGAFCIALSARVASRRSAER